MDLNSGRWNEEAGGKSRGRDLVIGHRGSGLGKASV